MARATVRFPRDVLRDIVESDGKSSKGDVATVATIAGITGAKATPSLIPMCHPVGLSGVDVEVHDADLERSCVVIDCTAKAVDRTGVEMEALTGATVAALTMIDMCKAAAKGSPRGIEIAEVRLLRKEGGKSGTWVAE